MLSIFVCLLCSLLFSSLQTTCQPATEFLDQHGFHFPILQLYSFRFFLVSSADQRKTYQRKDLSDTRTHMQALCSIPRATIHSQQGSALAVGLERLGTGVLHLLACSTLEVGQVYSSLTQEGNNLYCQKSLRQKKVIQQRLPGMLKHPSRMGMAQISSSLCAANQSSRSITVHGQVRSLPYRCIISNDKRKAMSRGFCVSVITSESERCHGQAIQDVPHAHAPFLSS